MPKPSILTSSLSIFALISLVAIIGMIFLDKKVDPLLIGVLTNIISGYLGSRIPTNKQDGTTHD